MYDQTGLVDCQIGLIKLVISKTDPVDCKIGLIDYSICISNSQELPD